MHMPGAQVANIMHPAFCPRILSYTNILDKCAHTGCTGPEMYAPGSQNMHTGCRVHL